MTPSDLSGLKAGVSVLRSDHDLFVFHDTSDRTGLRVARFGTTDFLNIAARAVRIVGELGADGWITGEWSENPVPGIEIEWQQRMVQGVYSGPSERAPWNAVLSFRPVQTVSVGASEPEASNEAEVVGVPTEPKDAAVIGLLAELDRLSALEPGWYANVGKKTGEQCCAAMTEAASVIRSLTAELEAEKGRNEDLFDLCQHHAGVSGERLTRAERAEARLKEAEAARRTAEVEVDMIVGAVGLLGSDFEQLEENWPVSKRGSRAMRHYQQIKDRIEAVGLCAKDARSALSSMKGEPS